MIAGLTQNGIARLIGESTALPVRTVEPEPVHHDKEAAAYDAMVRRHAWLLNRPFVKMVSRLPLETGRVLDVGTGPGWIPIELALRKPGWEIWAVDASEDMLVIARRHAEEAGVADRVHFVLGNAVDLPFTTGWFDVTLSHFLLHHIEQPADLLDGLARVTRGGGRILVRDLIRQPRWKTLLLSAFTKLVLGYSKEQLQMYRESLASSLTVAELREALRGSRLCMASVRGMAGLELVISA